MPNLYRCQSGVDSRQPWFNQVARAREFYMSDEIYALNVSQEDIDDHFHPEEGGLVFVDSPNRADVKKRLEDVVVKMPEVLLKMMGLE